MIEISRIVAQNPWWKFGPDFALYDENLRRYNEASLKIVRKSLPLSTGNIYAIHGPRQVGKTTEMKKTIQELIRNGQDPDSICYFSCDGVVSEKELQKVLDFFLAKLMRHEKIYIFLDEVNFVKNWVPLIKRIADEGNFGRIVIVLTGSPFGLKVHTHELIGRGIEGNRYFLRPLSFRDFILQVSGKIAEHTPDSSLRAELRNLRTHLETTRIDLERPMKEQLAEIERSLSYMRSLGLLFEIYLRTGGFPAVINSYLANFSKEEKIEAKFYEMFVELVVRDTLRQGKSDRIMQQVLAAILKRMGSRYDFKSLGEETEEQISHPTILEYLRLLEDNFLIQVLYAYDFSRSSIKVKGAKKVHFLDPFIFHSFNGWIRGRPGYSLSEEFLLEEQNSSILVEGIVQGHLARTKEIPVLKPPDRFLWFYYDRGELDFVYKRENGDFLGIEVRYRSKIGKEVYRIGSIREYLLLSKDDFDIGEDLMTVPVPVFLSLLQESEKSL
jgi:predicted AAA+ superfamily ATPase